ncbi:MAG TPA: 50S ribosomal protein L29 [Steroidobacteraceae bacterium]
MKASELHKKSTSELHTEMLSLRKEQFALRLQRATGQTVKPDQFSKVRRNIARVKTIQRAKRAGGKT